MVLLIIIIITSISIFIIYEKNNINSFKFMSIGDGVSLGLNQMGKKSYSYNDYLNEYLNNQKKNVSYFNYSQQNISIPELTNEIIYLKNKTLKEYLQTSNLIILSIGEKEIIDNKSLKIIEENLTNLIKEIKKYNSNICLLSRYNNDENQKIRIKEINRLYHNLAKKNNIIFININNSIYLKNKFNYPSVNEHKKIGKMIINAKNLN